MPDTHVTIVGNLTDDPEVTFTPNGAAVTNFRLAVTARIKDGEGWRDGDTSFYRITAWRQLAEHIGDSLAKGNRVIVLGQLRARSWETPEGERRTVVEVQAEEVGPSLRWATAKPERATQRQARARASSTTTRPSEPWRAVRPGRMRPVPASRTTSPRRPSDAAPILPDPAGDPDTPSRPALRLAPAAWLVDRLLPDCGHELGRSRDQEAAERASGAAALPTPRPRPGSPSRGLADRQRARPEADGQRPRAKARDRAERGHRLCRPGRPPWSGEPGYLRQAHTLERLSASWPRCWPS